MIFLPTQGVNLFSADFFWCFTQCRFSLFVLDASQNVFSQNLSDREAEGRPIDSMRQHEEERELCSPVSLERGVQATCATLVAIML